MIITILGSNGVIGNGISQVLCQNYNLKELNSEVFDKKNNKYKLSKFRDCDVFIHAAGVTDEEVKNKGEKKAFIRSTKAITELLKYLIKKNCKYFIYISSMRVYKSSSHIKMENRSKIFAEDFYEKCHIETEKVFNYELKKANLEFLILRPGAVYGFSKNQKKIRRHNLIPYSFPKSLVTKQFIKLKTSGSQYRNFCSNTDIGSLAKVWLESSNKNKIKISNVKGKTTINILQFAKLCRNEYFKMFKKKSYIFAPKNKKNKLPLKINQSIKYKCKSQINIFLKSYFKNLKNESSKKI